MEMKTGRRSLEQRSQNGDSVVRCEQPGQGVPDGRSLELGLPRGLVGREQLADDLLAFF